MSIREQIYKNVKALAQLNGREMKDVEKSIGRTPGYLSRKNSSLNVLDLITLAQMFNVSVDDMINGDYEKELKTHLAAETLENAVNDAIFYFSDEKIRQIVERRLKTEDEE
jgi:hypothetical protein